MARKKVTTLFNKNHVSIIKIVGEELPSPVRSHYTPSQPKIENWVKHQTIYETPRGKSWWEVEKEQNKKAKPITERVKSPLGFYYTRTIHPQKLVHEKTESKTKHVWVFYNSDGRYELTYYTEYNGTRANVEIHPWNLIDKKAMEDNFITALLEEITSIIECTKTKQEIELEQPQRNMYIGGEEHHYAGNLGEVRKLIFTDLFGYPDGPKYQTNDEKILSHGFDLKTSFRKM